MNIHGWKFEKKKSGLFKKRPSEKEKEKKWSWTKAKEKKNDEKEKKIEV